MIVLFHCSTCGEDKPLQDMHSASLMEEEDIVYQTLCVEYGQTYYRHLCRDCERNQR